MFESVVHLNAKAFEDVQCRVAAGKYVPGPLPDATEWSCVLSVFDMYNLRKLHAVFICVCLLPAGLLDLDDHRCLVT